MTRPLLLYNVPKCGPDKERNVCNRGSKCFICGLVIADLMMMFPKECPMKLILEGFRPHASTWYKISATSLSVIVSKSENVSPCNFKREKIKFNQKWSISKWKVISKCPPNIESTLFYIKKKKLSHFYWWLTNIFICLTWYKILISTSLGFFFVFYCVFVQFPVTILNIFLFLCLFI